MLAITLACSIAAPLYAQTDCSPGLGEKATNFAASNCDVIDKMNSCAEKAVDPDAMKKRVEELFANSEAKDAEIKKDWKKYARSDLAQLYNSTAKGAESGYYVDSILDWVTINGSIEGIDKETVKQTIIKNYVEFAKKNDCVPVINHSGGIVESYPKNYKVNANGGMSRYQVERDFKAEMNAPALVEKRKEYFKEYNANFEKSGQICNPNQLEAGPYTAVAVEFPPCAGNMAGYFADNAWSNSSLNLNDTANSELIACVKDRLSKGAKIHHISITSSASLLNNTGEAAKLFCKKGFAGLSQKRAEVARDEILPQIFAQAGAADTDYSSKVQLDSAGANKDGTSGPCPYQIVNGKESLKSEYQTAEGRKSLDKEKYVKIHITFEKSTKSTPRSSTNFEPYYRCRRIDFSCKR